MRKLKLHLEMLDLIDQLLVEFENLTIIEWDKFYSMIMQEEFSMQFKVLGN